MKKITAPDILTRSEYSELILKIQDASMEYLKDKKVLITGSSGSLGETLGSFLSANDIVFKGIDIESGLYTSTLVDITNKVDVENILEDFKPDVIFHLAANKHAPVCEIDPNSAIDSNIVGTRNIIEGAEKYKIQKVVFASTCKAINPETVYGASKLIAERYVISKGYTVARFFNVVETSGNVFRLWEESVSPYPAMPCYRYFISLREAVALLLFCTYNESGSYMIDPGDSLYIPDICQNLYGKDACMLVSPRKGDRIREPLHATNETIESIDGPIARIKIL